MKKSVKRKPMRRHFHKALKGAKYGLQGMIFGSMDGVITTMGVLMGLFGASQSKEVIIVGVLAAGIADSFANATGFHVAEESEMIHTRREIWKSTITTFISTFIAVLLIVLPVIFIPNTLGIIVSGLLGCVLLTFLAFYVNKITGMSKHSCLLALEYVGLGVVVSLMAYGVGELVHFLFL
ncbi:VIT1/CCC1 transporter family protein [Nanoarchaeota archaeon]